MTRPTQSPPADNERTVSGSAQSCRSRFVSIGGTASGDEMHGKSGLCAKVKASAWADGTWRSLVAHLTGGQGVAGSNPAVPTVFRTLVPRNGNETCHDHSHLTGRDEQSIESGSHAILMIVLPRSRTGGPVRHLSPHSSAGGSRPARHGETISPAPESARVQAAQGVPFRRRTHQPPHPDPRRQGGPSPA